LAGKRSARVADTGYLPMRKQSLRCSARNLTKAQTRSKQDRHTTSRLRRLSLSFG
jgi:hypothetical protein